MSSALCRWTTAAMIDSPIQTVASSSTATLSDSWLRSRCRTRRSAKILTITGTALTDSASPAKTAKVAVVASGPRNRGSAASANATVDSKGSTKAPTRSGPPCGALARTNPMSTVAPATPTSQDAAEGGDAAEELVLPGGRCEQPGTSLGGGDRAEDGRSEQQTGRQLTGCGRETYPLGQPFRGGRPRPAGCRAGAGESSDRGRPPWGSTTSAQRPRCRDLRSRPLPPDRR